MVGSHGTASLLAWIWVKGVKMETWHKDENGKYVHIAQVTENGKRTYYTDGKKSGEDNVNGDGTVKC